MVFGFGGPILDVRFCLYFGRFVHLVAFTIVSLSSEPGLDSNRRVFIVGWSVFAFSGRPVAVGG